MKKLIAALGAVLVSLTIFSGCGEVEKYSNKYTYFVAMNAEAVLAVSDVFTSEKQNKYKELCSEISNTLTSLDASLSANISNSSISKFNAAAAGEKVEIDLTAYKVLTLAKSVYDLTEGFYNPAVYYSVQAYGFNESSELGQPLDERIPSDDLIAKYNILSAAFGDIEIIKDDNNKCYAVKSATTIEIDGVTYSMKIDLGGIGKGYAVDEINKLIDRYGFKYGYFNFGTSSISIREHYKNDDYSLNLTNPRSDIESGTYFSTKIRNACLSTSGDYEQFFLYDSDGDGVKERYCHIFDPTTGKPVQTGIMSATVIGGSAAEDDALTTAIMAMGKDKAVEFINGRLTGRKVTFAFDNGGSYEIITNIPESEFTVTHSKFTVANTLTDGKIVLG